MLLDEVVVFGELEESVLVFNFVGVESEIRFPFGVGLVNGVGFHGSLEGRGFGLEGYEHGG